MANSNEWRVTQPTRCKGLITEKDQALVDEVYSKQVADMLRNAKEGDTFLMAVFHNYAEEMASK